MLLFLLLLLGGVFFFLDQQNRIQVETVEIPSARLPAAFDGFRIVQISDLHGKQFGAENADLIAAVAALAPDLIAITGDLVDRPAELAALPALAQGLAALAPTYYVTGNHEWASRTARDTKRSLAENGVTPLSNEYLPLTRGGAQILLAGIDDPNGPYDQKSPETLLDELRADFSGDPYVLLLAHRNEYDETYDRCGVDLTLCGHGHGGLIRLPFTDGLVDNTRMRFFPTHTAGAYALPGGGTLMVSRGLGNIGASFRLWNRPHLPLIVLRAVP